MACERLFVIGRLLKMTPNSRGFNHTLIWMLMWRDRADVIEVTGRKVGRLSWIWQGPLESLKVEKFFPLESELQYKRRQEMRQQERTERCKARGLNPLAAGWLWRQGMKEAYRSWEQLVNSQRGNRSCTVPPSWILPAIWASLQNGFFPPPPKACRPVCSLISAS